MHKANNTVSNYVWHVTCTLELENTAHLILQWQAGNYMWSRAFSVSGDYSMYSLNNWSIFFCKFKLMTGAERSILTENI